MNSEDGRRKPAGVGARLNEFEGSPDLAGRVRLKSDGSVTIAAIDEASDWILEVAMTCENEVAAKAHRVRCLRAARGGTSNTSQTAARFLAHPRLKSVLLANEHRALLHCAAKAQEALRPLMVEVINKMLQVELYLADVQRCEDAIAGKHLREIAQKETGLWPEARCVVSRLAAAGIQEGHWSTITRATEQRIIALLQADNASAGVGSPDDPQMAVDRESEL